MSDFDSVEGQTDERPDPLQETHGETEPAVRSEGAGDQALDRALDRAEEAINEAKDAQHRVEGGA